MAGPWRGKSQQQPIVPEVPRWRSETQVGGVGFGGQANQVQARGGAHARSELFRDRVLQRRDADLQIQEIPVGEVGEALPAILFPTQPEQPDDAHGRPGARVRGDAGLPLRRRSVSAHVRRGFLRGHRAHPHADGRVQQERLPSGSHVDSVLCGHRAGAGRAGGRRAARASAERVGGHLVDRVFHPRHLHTFAGPDESGGHHWNYTVSHTCVGVVEVKRDGRVFVETGEPLLL